jgi:hypothetical protein
MNPRPTTNRARQRDFEEWESELPATGRVAVPGVRWFRRRVSGPVRKWLHYVGRSALAPERFL